MKSGRGALAGLLLVSLQAWCGPESMPLLPDDRLRLYTQRAFENFPVTVNEAVNERYDELVAAGMDTSRHLFDWRDLELSSGVYDTAPVVSAMEADRARGIQHQFANLVVIDSDGPVVPEYIQALVDQGTSWDDPQITSAFSDLLDVIVPIMLERDLFMLGLSNEPDGYFEAEPAAAATFKGFIQSAVSRAHALEGDLATTVVFAGPADRSIPDLLALTDVATFNTYFYFPEDDPDCRSNGEALPLFRSDRASNVGEYLDQLIQVANGQLVNIQEIGQASFGATLGGNTSEANQAAVYRALNAALASRQDRIRTVCNWTLNDHAEAWLPLAEAARAEGLPQCFADNVVDIFTLTGLVRSDASAARKPAFSEFLAGVERFAAGTAAGVPIGREFAGAWFDALTPGQGFLIDVDPENEFVFVAWFTFTAGDATGANGQRWYTAQGSYAAGAASDLVLSATTGGELDGGRPITTVPVGLLSLRFESCQRGVVDYSFDETVESDAAGGQGTIDISRLLDGAAASCETGGSD